VKRDADQVGHVRGVDDLVDGARPDDQRRPYDPRGLGFRAIKQKVAGKVQYDLDTAAGQDAFALAEQLRNLRVPERVDTLAERGGGGAFEVDHKTSSAGYSTIGS
jgi:hypothetical protein